MARRVVLLIFLAYGSCMQMRETVERRVMVRTTGSDLQPAATGYIYKKESDGPASVVEMGETEVMEHLAKFYEQPAAYAAPIPAAAGPFHANEDADKASSRVIPVKEKTEEELDGLADDDYRKLFADYGFDNKEFTNYFHGIPHYNGHYGHGGSNEGTADGDYEEGEKGQKGNNAGHRYGNSGAGDYHTEKYASYSISSKGGHKGYDADGYGQRFGDGQKRGNEGFHKVYDQDEDKKDDEVHDGANKGFVQYDDGHKYHGSGAGFESGDGHESRHNEAVHGRSNEQSGEQHDSSRSAEEGESSKENDRGFGLKERKRGGKSYGFVIKH